MFAKSNFIQWRKNYRIWMIAAIETILIFRYLHGLSEYGQATGKTITPFVLPIVFAEAENSNMRSQIRGLNKASDNASDGVSLIQTAEGALNETHSILQRMNELAVQGANDTNQSIDRDAINQELSALTDEIDRISETTQFNKQNLLDGSFTGKNLQVGANTDQKITINIAQMNAEAIGFKKGYCRWSGQLLYNK